MESCLFCNIVKKELSAKIEYEDDDIIVIHDIQPKADIHLLIIPKEHIGSMINLYDRHVNLMGKIMLTTSKIAAKYGLEGYKVQINNGVKGGQEVFHLHVHLVGNK